MWILDELQVSDPSIGQKINHKKALRRRLRERDGNLCVWCAKEMTEMTMDHVVPDSLGGPMTSYNLIPACRSCNSSRQARSALEWYRRSLKRGYHPDGLMIVQALRDALLYGDVQSNYSLYYVVAQLESPEFSPLLATLEGPLTLVIDYPSRASVAA